jgi:hypothetical protein
MARTPFRNTLSLLIPLVLFMLTMGLLFRHLAHNLGHSLARGIRIHQTG